MGTISKEKYTNRNQSGVTQMRQIQTPPKYKRKNCFINKPFQTNFIIKFCLIIALGSMITILLVYYLAQNSTTVAIINGKVAVHTTAEYLLPLMFQTVLIELFLISIATVYLTLLISHKIAGPLYRLNVCLNALGEGNFLSMHLRTSDQLQEISATYNKAIKELNNKIKILKNSPSSDESRKILDSFKLL